MIKEKDASHKITVVFGLSDLIVGGMQKQFVRLCHELDRSNVQIILLTLFSFSNRESLYGQLPKDVKVYKLSFRGFFDLSSWLQLIRLLKKLRPDVVVSSLFFSNTVFRILKPFFSYKSITREHISHQGRAWLQKKINAYLARYNSSIVAVSKTVADTLSAEEGIARNKYQVIHNGIDVAAAQAQVTSFKPLKKNTQEPIFLHVARLTPQKNQAALLDGFANFLLVCPGAQLEIVGEGPLRKELENQVVTLGIENSVRFFGYQESVWRYLSRADALIITSHYEGMSNSMLEALAAGVPVLSTMTAGADEVIIENINGIFISGTSAQEITEAMNVFYKRPLTNKPEIYETVAPFDIAKTARKYENLFRSVIIQ